MPTSIKATPASTAASWNPSRVVCFMFVFWFSLMAGKSDRRYDSPDLLLLKFFVTIVDIVLTYGTAPTPLPRGRGRNGQLYPRFRAQSHKSTVSKPADYKARARAWPQAIPPPWPACGAHGSGCGLLGARP